MQESGCLQQGIWHRLLLVHYDGHCDACNALQRLCWLILKAPDELMRPSVSTTLLCTVHRTRAQRAANLELTHHYYNLHATARPKRTLLNLQGSSSMASKLCSSSYKIGRPIADGMRKRAPAAEGQGKPYLQCGRLCHTAGAQQLPLPASVCV